MWSKEIEEVFDAISRERDFQDAKYGPVTIPPFNREQGRGGHELGTWLVILRKELEEAETAIVHGGSKQGTGRNHVRAELVQIAAVAVAALEQHGLTEPEGEKL